MAGSKPGRPRTLGPTCGARKTDGSGRCKQPAGADTPHTGWGNCVDHGGNTPSGMKYARRLQAQAATERFGVPVDGDAGEALVEEQKLARGQLRFVRAQLAKLSPADMVSGTERATRKTRNGQVIEETLIARYQEHVWWKVLYQLQRHHAGVAAEILRLGLEAKRLQLAKDQGDLLFRTTIEIMREYGIDTDDDRFGAVVVEAINRVTQPGWEAPLMLEGEVLPGDE